MNDEAEMSPGERRLLIVDDDKVFCDRLAQAMERRGFAVARSYSLADTAETAARFLPSHAVIDLRLADGSGLDLVARLRELVPDCRAVMLTGYGNIATAVAAVKAGAIDYLPKPADADQITAALLGASAEALPPPPEDPMTADRVRWEHIQRVYEQCGRNVSETARRLKMHRRTLQRILGKYAPRT